MAESSVDKPRQLKWADLTMYPDLYRNTYWGNFEFKSNVQPGIGVLEARNNFVVKYGIVSTTSIPREQSPEYCRFYQTFKYAFDHVEVYKSNRNEIILISSPYNHVRKDLESFCYSYGFNFIPNMYMEGATTTIMAYTKHVFREL